MMKRFVKLIKEKEERLKKSYAKSELKNIEKITSDLETQHQQIKDDLIEINYLLSLIEEHQIKAANSTDIKKTGQLNNWLTKIKIAFEKYHLRHVDTLSAADITFLQNEKRNLELEKTRLEVEHHYIHALIAKAKVYEMDVFDSVCKELTKGQTITEVGEKLVAHFGKQLANEMTYDMGRRQLMRFIENTFAIDRIRTKKLIDVLEKSKVINFKIDISTIPVYPDLEIYSDFSDVNYIPLFGIWHINA